MKYKRYLNPNIKVTREKQKIAIKRPAPQLQKPTHSLMERLWKFCLIKTLQRKKPLGKKPCKGKRGRNMTNEFFFIHKI